MSTTDTGSLPSFVRQMLADLDSQEEQDRQELSKIEEKIHTIQERIRTRTETKDNVLQLYSPNTQQRPVRTAKPTVDPRQCPLTHEQMRRIGNRREVLIAISKASPGLRVRPTVAIHWMHAAGIIKTDPDNAGKSLARYMRKHPEIWEPQERGWYRLVGALELMNTTPPQPPNPTDQADHPSETGTDQEGPNEDPQQDVGSSGIGDDLQLSQPQGTL